MQSDQAYMALYGDLPRQGVGTDWCTREAIRRLPPLRKPTAILDLGCGPGRQSIVLAKHFQSPVQAVDHCPLFLEYMKQAAAAAEVAELIRPRLEDFTHLPDPDASFDLIWSEGGAQVMGMQASLEAWKPLLRNRGVMVISDFSWLVENPPPEAQAFWSKAYPTMTDIEGNLAIAQRAGLRVFEHFLLPRAAWWDEYYAPLQRRIAVLKQEPSNDKALAAKLAEAEAEIALFQRWGSSYGYIFYLMRPA